MAEEDRDTSEIKDTDIIFDCPYCGKSLAIDYRGAGLVIPCTDCGKPVEVPIPDGMQISDIDNTAEEQEMQILNLRRSLAMAEARIDNLENELRDIAARRDELEKGRTDSVFRIGSLAEKVDNLELSLKEAAQSLETIAGVVRSVKLG
jgi:predicted  nucleic acid-binding Zn-ribbon protein